MPYIERETIIKYHMFLMKHDTLVQLLKKERGLTKETLRRFEIGYDSKDKRFTIPIKNYTGNYINIRKYKLQAKDGEPKVISYGKGFGEVSLFPFDNLKDDNQIILCEGEMDCILLNQNDYNAVTCTGGAGTWKKEWDSHFEGKKIAIVFDCDDAGRKGAHAVTNKLLDVAGDVKIIDLGLDNKEDITDWFIKYKKTDEQLDNLIRKTETEDLYELIDLSDGLKDKYYDKKLKFNCVVVSKDLAPYLVPTKVEAQCSGSGDHKHCAYCVLADHQKKKKKFTYEDDKVYLAKMVNSTDDQVLGIIKKAMGLPVSSVCRQFNVDIKSRQNIEDVKVIPEVNTEIIDREYVVRKCLTMGTGVQTNAPYLMRGTTVQDPLSQQGIHLVKDCKGSRDSISKFRLNNEIIRNLKKFQPKQPDDKYSITAKLKDIHKDFTYNVTKIYNRENLIFGKELVTHSVQQFYFLGDLINKGWLEMTVVGDTRTGKTETIRNMVKHYRAGEFLTSGENTTTAGLIGGAQQTHSGRWTLTWGKIPLNNNGELNIDEADELSKREIIGDLSGIRSSGIAELVKIQSQRTNARTRLIFIANPLHGRMNTYNYGVEAIREIFKTQQDTARIDFAICVSADEVSKTVINKISREKCDHVYTSDVCHDGVLFSWSRRAENIKFAKGTEQLILDHANELADIYSFDIPLVLAAEMRIKLARMAVSLATRLFSVDESMENVIVYPAHVLVVSKFLQANYNNYVMGYYDYSEQKKLETTMDDPDDRLGDVVRNKIHVALLLNSTKFQMNDFEDIFAVDTSGAKNIVHDLRRIRAVRKQHSFYLKTPAFIEYLKRKKAEFGRHF